MKKLLILIPYLLISCQYKVVCPAYQSAYILDKSTRQAYFSYVWQLDEDTRTQFLAQQNTQESEDSLQIMVEQPKTDYYAYVSKKIIPRTFPKRTKYGTIKKVVSPIKNFQLKIAPKKNILAPEDPISTNFVASEIGSLPPADSFSIAIDSINKATDQTKPAIAKDKTKFLYGYDPKDNFNVEQEYYNKYFGEQLIDNRQKKPSAPLDSLSSDSVKIKKSFLRNLFKKKPKLEEDESIPIEIPEEQIKDTLEKENDG